MIPILVFKVLRHSPVKSLSDYVKLTHNSENEQTLNQLKDLMISNITVTHNVKVDKKWHN